ncbi:MAG: NaMN--DMB phosphoribosyltransferase [Synechococcus sp. LacPavin_0920_WC12_MAG_50_7]|nr:NaMN--DMB phosphoribosyltransferase [Synechococcus sp. LacPavin_0920_WC12_MAG_50_7]
MIPSSWCKSAKGALLAQEVQVLLVLGGTATAEVPGISAAGATPASRQLTAAADAELLVMGPAAQCPHRLPPLLAGVSPALISLCVLERLGLPALVVDAGCAVAPAIPHIRLGGTPARCLSSGKAMELAAVLRLQQQGLRLGYRWAQCHPQGLLVLAECVPGGTSTAEAVLSGLGLDVAGLVSGSMRVPPHGLRATLVQRGIAAAIARGCELGNPLAVLAAVLALALARAGLPLRQVMAQRFAVVTTAWVMQEACSELAELLIRVGASYGVEPLLSHANLHFDNCEQQALRDYELGFVKEGVGAGGLSWLWELAGFSPQDLAVACDQACAELLYR